jgi:hypothetical protein
MNSCDFKEIICFQVHFSEESYSWMKHIHFVIFIDWKVLLFIVVILFYILTHFFIICIYLEIEFIKPSDDVKIQRKIITFTKDEEDRTVFINKVINSGIMKMFTFCFYSFYIYIFYFISQMLCICTDNCGCFSMRNTIFLL